LASATAAIDTLRRWQTVTTRALNWALWRLCVRWPGDQVAGLLCLGKRLIPDRGRAPAQSEIRLTMRLGACASSRSRRKPKAKSQTEPNH
jgi:hypothetical protein